jgi:signal transduction histidine kinase
MKSFSLMLSERFGKSRGHSLSTHMLSSTRQLSRSQDALHELLSQLLWPALLTDHAGIITAMNPAWSTWAPSSNAGVGRSLQDALPEYWPALNDKVPWLRPQTLEVVRETPGGKAHERVLVHPLETGACIIVVDESRLRELELAHRQMGRLASMGFMLASVCHEVANPLATVQSTLQVLQSQSRIPPAGLQNALANLASNVGRVLAITRRLNAFSRVDDESPVCFNVDFAIDEALAFFRQDRWGANVQIERRADPEGIVLGYPGRLQQVFFNIFMNAAQAMQGRGAISAVTRLVAERSVEVTITDTGPGIAPENLPRVFEAFFSTKAAGEGTGLGLAICYEIVHEHGGEIRVENAPPRGASFIISLPFGAGPL